MHCPVCAHENSPGARFCLNCGNVLPLTGKAEVRACPLCKHLNAAGAVFCEACGRKLIKDSKHFCQQCGKEIRQGAAFCPHCGETLNQHPHIVCRACSFVNVPGAAFCERCGTGLLRQSPAVSGLAHSKEKGLRTKPSWILFVFRFLVSSFLGFIGGKLVLWAFVLISSGL